MPPSPFLDALRERVLVCDGATGTMLYARGVFLNRSFDELNLTQPDLVAEVHQAYVRAGADVIETNTFGANRFKLSAFGLADKLHAVNVQGARLARHAARDRAWVAGAIGPLGVRLRPLGKMTVDEAAAAFREQAAALIDGGIDLVILETFRDPAELAAAIAAIRGVSALPIIAQMTTDEGGHSLDGTPPETFVPILERAGADVVGLNCSVGPAAMLETVERIARVTRLPIAVQPNAGRPREVEGRNFYLCSPEYMGSYARRFVLAGARLVGGCCGTTPGHIRAISAAVRVSASAPPRVMPRTSVAPPPVRAEPPVARQDRSRLAHTLGTGSFAVTVELLPPRGCRYDDILDEARQLRARGVDAVAIPDGPRASARMSALALAVLLERQAGIETLLHYACRDRNLRGMQSDLLGAHALGVRNLLVVTGDPTAMGDYPDATEVFDVDSIGLTHLVSRMNRGLDLGGQPIGEPTSFHVGVAVNPFAVDLEEELRRFEVKVEAGADFAVTQPVFDLPAFEGFLERVGGIGIPIVAGVWPFDSIRRAEFLANEVPGVSVPEALLARMRRAEADGTADREGLAIARELVAALRRLARGIQVSVPAGGLGVALQVLDTE